MPILEKLMRTGKEFTVTDTGICLVYFKSKKVIDKRRQTALMKHLQQTSSSGAQEFLDMALDNKFAYDRLEMVQPKDIRGWKPHIKMCGLFVYSLGPMALYVCRSPFQDKTDTYGPADKKRCNVEHPEMFAYYNLGRLTFDSVQSMIVFKKFLEID